jgi:hypothetical protein
VLIRLALMLEPLHQPTWSSQTAKIAMPERENEVSTPHIVEDTSRKHLSKTDHSLHDYSSCYLF